MTHKLFHDDVMMREFDAQVLSCEPLDAEKCSKYGGKSPLYCVRLNQTAFYAESGGQTCDTGTLGDAQIIDVQEDEKGGDIYHVATAPVSGMVHGSIDWERRFSNMQQHGGQHLLSWAVNKQLGGYTFGLHIGAQENSIDTDLKEVPDRATLDRMESAANALVWQDLPVHQWFPTDEEMKTLPLRKKPTVSENIRIVMTGDVECVACCGTHPTSSGQIGMIAVLGAHPARGKVRISFLCGARAFARLKAEAEACRAAGSLVSATYEDLVDETQRLIDSSKELKREIGALKQEQLLARLPELENVAQVLPCGKAVVCRFGEADRDSLIKAASKLIEKPGIIALLSAGNADGAGDIAVFACSDDVKGVNMGALLKNTLTALGGRGGGRPAFAQGGAPVEISEAALKEAANTLGGV